MSDELVPQVVLNGCRHNNTLSPPHFPAPLTCKVAVRPPTANKLVVSGPQNASKHGSASGHQMSRHAEPRRAPQRMRRTRLICSRDGSGGDRRLRGAAGSIIVVNGHDLLLRPATARRHELETSIRSRLGGCPQPHPYPLREQRRTEERASEMDSGQLVCSVARKIRQNLAKKHHCSVERAAFQPACSVTSQLC